MECDMQVSQAEASNVEKGGPENSPPSAKQVDAPTSAVTPSRFRATGRRLKLWWKNIAAVVVSASAVVTAGAIIALVVVSLTRDSIDIEPILTPKVLADNGYTPEVAAAHLRDAMHRAVEFALSTRPEIALREDHLDVVVPTVGLSVHTIARSVRKLLPVTQRPTISGEFTLIDGKLWLRLRADGREFYANGRGIPPKRLDHLMNAAAESILREFWPIYVAVKNFRTDPDFALETAEYIIATVPRSDVAVALAHRLAGAIYTNRKQYERAKGEFEKSLALGKTSEDKATDHAALGIVLRFQGNDREADEQFRKAAELLPRDDFRVVVLRLGEAKPELALAELREYMKRNALKSGSHTFFGIVLGSMGRQDEAISAYRKAIKLDPDNVAARFNLAAILADKKLMDEATAEYQKAAEAHPRDSRNAEFRMRLGIILRDQGKLDEAIAEFARAIDLFPDDVSLHVELGVTLRQQGNSDQAIAQLQKALELDPRSFGARRWLSDCLREQGRFDEAIVQARRAIELEPRSGPARHVLGLTLLQQGNRDEAIAEFRKTLELDPRAWVAYLDLAVALQEQGKLDEAMRELRNGLMLEPRVARAYFHLGTMLREQGKPDEALAEFRRAIEIEPRDAGAHFNLASILRSQGKLGEAIDAFRNGLGVDAGNANVHYEFALALAALLTSSMPHESRVETLLEACQTLVVAQRLAATDAVLLAEIRRLNRSLVKGRPCTQAALSRAVRGSKTRR
jgi:tetratricopeptide (TPR) repeat protein